MKPVSIQNLSFKYGIVTAISYMLFFLLMRALGLAEIYGLRALNILILFGGVYLSMKKYRSIHGHTTYLKMLSVGMMTAVVSLAFFAVFVMIYLGLDEPFMTQVRKNEYFGEYLNPYIAGAAIFLEGTISGLLVAFILMQYWKSSHMESKDDLAD